MNETKLQNVELYLLIIVVKLSIFMGIKILKACLKAYHFHNDKVINRHNKSSIEELAKRREAVPKIETNSREIP